MSSRVFLIAISCLALSAGCATAPVVPSGPRAAEFSNAGVGHSWSYMLTPGPDEPQAVRIVSRDERGFYVDDRGGRLAPRSDGLFDGDRFLLKEPVVAGATWIAMQKGPRRDVPGVTEQYRIVATDLRVTVPAGTYDGCVEVEGASPTRDPETGRPATVLMRWVWARQVGMIRLQQFVKREGDEAPVLTATMALTAFTPAAP